MYRTMETEEIIEIVKCTYIGYTAIALSMRHIKFIYSTIYKDTMAKIKKAWSVKPTEY